MTAPSHNHANYQARLDYIRGLLGDHFGLSNENIAETKITPIQYEADFPFKYNNFVYRLEFPVDISDDGLKLPGCVPIPADSRAFIMRLSNPDAEGMYQETRVQNEVAILTLASAALGHIKPNIVPRVFGWGGASQGRLGWILQDLMPGVPLDDVFSPTGSLEQKTAVLRQMAAILKALQDYPLPESIRGWGGLTFDSSGAIVSAPMPSVGAGPWSSLENSYRGRLKAALDKADKNPYLKGWRPNGIRDRVDNFIERGLSAQFSDLTSSQDRAIIHADFTSDNLLHDPATGLITALLDYDFSTILHPAYEFFRSFGPNGGQFTGWIADSDPEGQELLELRRAKLSGEFPSPLPTPRETPNSPGVDWELAQAWENELQKINTKRPSTIQGIDKLADVDELLGSLKPWRLTNTDFLRMNKDEGQRMALRRMGEEQLAAVLDHLGF
ncbi:kinase-like domain-containing protein [Cladorrhinum sp. PSN332]|nr:kinase-like domain-containing protein [Cladorrhinum sp. PSN332]